MRVEIKLYKNFDADLLSLHTGGISIPNLMNIALKGYVNNNIPRFYVTETRDFKFEGAKRFLHISFEINDRKSEIFLKKEIKYRQRTAFLKSLLRYCLVSPNLGIYLKNSALRENENKKIKDIDISSIRNLIIIDYPDLSLKNANKKIKIEEISPTSSYKPIEEKNVKEQISKNNNINKEETNKNIKDLNFNNEDDLEYEDTISEDDLNSIDQDELMAQFLNLKQ